MKAITTLVLALITLSLTAQTMPPAKKKVTQVWGGMMYVDIKSLQHSAPFTTCTITVQKSASGAALPNPVTKTAWLKNVPSQTVARLDKSVTLSAQQADLYQQKRKLDTMDLNGFSSVETDNYNRLNLSYQQESAKFGYEQAENQALLQRVEHERAMPTTLTPAQTRTRPRLHPAGVNSKE
jgi:hypothetical protein